MTPFYGIIIVGNYFTAALWTNGKIIWRSTRMYPSLDKAQQAVKFLNREHATRHPIS